MKPRGWLRIFDLGLKPLSRLVGGVADRGYQGCLAAREGQSKRLQKKQKQEINN